MFQGSLFQCFGNVSPNVSPVNPHKHWLFTLSETLKHSFLIDFRIRGNREIRGIIYLSKLSKSSHSGVIYAHAREGGQNHA